ncbi:MAG: flotillin family protein, partial [Catalinimonas sp.]
MFENVAMVALITGVFVLLMLLISVAKMYHKTEQGTALVRTGSGGTKVSFGGMMIVPVLHRLETMDISLKTIMISRQGKDGLVCKDNMRADIQVTFFVRVNPTKEDVTNVAQSIGCERASDPAALESLFDAKFSEALKTVGKHFDFVDLYNAREAFRLKIIDHIGTDLNGYVLDDCAIDYLEQTPLQSLNEHNILDAEGIKKITELTAVQKILANKIERDKEKTIKKQDVEAREAILELERQQTEKEEKQRREIANIRAREESDAARVGQEERLKSERARIQTDEEVQVAEENRERQVLVARKGKERTEAVEQERVLKDQALERTERERIVALAEIAKQKAIEEEQRNVQETIRERVEVQKSVVIEEERIKDTRALAEADRNKAVAIKAAEQRAEEILVEQIKQAEADREAAEFLAKQRIIEADAEEATAGKKAKAIKVLAEAEAAKAAAVGMAEAQVLEAKAAAREKQGEAEASVLEDAALAEAKGIAAKAQAQAKADQELGLVAAEITLKQGQSAAAVTEVQAAAAEQRGLAEARVLAERYAAEARGVRDKAEAMKALDGTGRDHEEFKLKLAKEKEIE